MRHCAEPPSLFNTTHLHVSRPTILSTPRPLVVVPYVCPYTPQFCMVTVHTRPRPLLRYFIAVENGTVKHAFESNISIEIRKEISGDTITAWTTGTEALCLFAPSKYHFLNLLHDLKGCSLAVYNPSSSVTLFPQSHRRAVWRTGGRYESKGEEQRGRASSGSGI